MRLFLHPVSLLSPHKHRISISSLKILVKNLRGKNPEVTDFTKGRDIMESTAKQYETATNNAAEISQVLLDMEGGKYVLTMFSELLQELLDEGNIPGAASVVYKLYEAVEVASEESALDGDSDAAWFSLFSGVLEDALENTVP